MRLPLSTLEAFNAVARNQSLRGAADSLGVKPSTISHQLKTLEEKLGASVFIRTTRSVKLTEAGSLLYKGTEPAFSQLSQAYESAQSSACSVSGALKLEVSDLVYDILLGPVLQQFCVSYPELAIELSISDGLSNLIDSGMHAGFCKGNIVSQDMVAVAVKGSLSSGVFATPEYLKKHPAPNRPRDLLDHNCIRYRFPTTKRIEEWVFSGEPDTQQQVVSGRLITSTRSSQLDLCLKDLGIIYTLKDYVEDELQSGRLVSLLDDYVPQAECVYIYFPAEYRSIKPLRILLEFLAEKHHG